MENDVRSLSSGSSEFAVIFETANVKEKSILYNYLLTEMLGQVEVNQFDLLELNSGKLNQEIYKKDKSVLAMEARNYHFSDSGFFMFRGKVSGNNVNNLIEKFSAQINKIGQSNKSEFERAKKKLSVNI